MKVGLSISYCIRDMAQGKVSMDEVKFISAGTRCESRDDWEKVISVYKYSYWLENPAESESILRHFLEHGLIIQPRLEGRDAVHYPEGRYWIEEEEYNQIAAESAEGHESFYQSREAMKRRYREEKK